MSAELRFLYVHIPKTGGVTFRQLLENSCRAQEIFHATPPESILEQDDQSLSRYRLVHGHFNLAQVSHLKGFRKVTALRDPLERCQSAYNFWRGLDADDGHWPTAAQSKIRAAQSCSLASMLHHPDPSIRHTFHNMQTRLLSAESDLEKPLGERHLQLAIEALRQFDFIGLNSELELSMQLLCHKFGLFLPDCITSLNSSRLKVVPDTATQRLLAQANLLDARLLDWVRRQGLYKLNAIPNPGLLGRLRQFAR